MFIKKIIIENFKCFEGKFPLELNQGLNVLVGDNETGKSTILEAIHLALSGWIYGRYLRAELTQSLFNNQVVNKYLDSLKNHNRLPPPDILIELFFEIEDDSLKAMFEGNGNSLRQKACGIQFKISFNEKYQNEYNILVESEDVVGSLPIEYYDFSWSSFARDDRLTPKIIPLKSSLIDSSNSRYQNGSDVYISRIIRELLTDEQKVNISQAHRKLKDSFAKEPTIKEINEKSLSGISEKKMELSVDMSTKTAWETSITTYLDGIPFSNIGKGEQCLVKTKLALSHKKSHEANVILLEEPENHLSHTKLNKLIKHITDGHKDKQIIVSTHNSFVANKLGLNSLILLNINKSTNKINETRITKLDEKTEKYFEKLAGFDTLRLILCKKAILVEGPSDELIVQKAYMCQCNRRLPIEDEVDVISVGTAFERFLKISEKLEKRVVVVTDNDGDVAALKGKYEEYLGEKKKDYIKICFDETVDSGELKIGKAGAAFNYNTLEPKLLKVNGLEKLNNVFGTTYSEIDDMHKHMKRKKTDCALKIFDTCESITFPGYITNAIN